MTNPITDHFARHNADVTLDHPAPADPVKACGATAWLDGKHRTCTLAAEHTGNHKTGRRNWRRRSGD